MSSQAYASDMFKENDGYQHAAILLYDTVKGSRQATKNILFNLGFREVQTVSDTAMFEDLLQTETFDLVVADITDEIEPVTDIVERLRHGDLGNNPFTVVMLTSGPLNPESLKLALDSGADDLLMRPLSIGGVQKRIYSLVNARKPFVVTSDYIGPDRRGDPNRPDSAELVPVPNSLKDRVEHGPQSARETANQIAEMREKVAEEHLHRLAVRLGVDAHQFVHAVEGSSEALVARDSIEDTAAEISSRIGPTRGQASELTRMLLNVLSGAKKVAPEKQRELILQLALGVGVGLREDGDEAAMAEEVRSTVEAINSRLGYPEDQPLDLN